MEDFSSYMAQERERLTAQRQAAIAAKHQAELDLAAVETEFHAINAYEAAKSGKRVTATKSNGTQRQRHGSRRNEILSVVQNSTGLKRREILEALGAKGDKTAEMSVSNALTALVKNGSLDRDGDGFYIVANPDTVAPLSEVAA